MKDISCSDNYNYGLAILRIWMCFEVVCCHYWKGEISSFWIVLNYSRDLAVPCFMIMSSYFLFSRLNDLKDEDYEYYAKRRLWKIAYPHIAWTFIIGLVEFICSMFDVTNSFESTDVLWQLFTGHKYNSPMWFQIDLLLLTAVILMIFRYTNNHKNVRFFVMTILLIGSITLQYTEVLFEIISSMKPEICYPLGRLIEITPYVVVGYYVVCCEKFLVKCAKMITCLTLIFLILYYAKHLNYFLRPNGFNYQGIMLLCGAVSVFLILYSIPLAGLFIPYDRLLRRISSAAMGVYCMHVELGRLLNKYVMNNSNMKDTLLECVLIFVACLFISCGLSRAKNKYIKNLFV